jgi:hypothetical protein
MISQYFMAASSDLAARRLRKSLPPNERTDRPKDAPNNKVPILCRKMAYRPQKQTVELRRRNVSGLPHAATLMRLLMLQ